MFQFHFQVGSIRKELREIMSALNDLQVSASLDAETAALTGTATGTGTGT